MAVKTESITITAPVYVSGKKCKRGDVVTVSTDDANYLVGIGKGLRGAAKLPAEESKEKKDK